MRVLGLLGGLSWRSTLEYYRLLNEGAGARLGGQYSAKLIIYSFDFQEMTSLKMQNDWPAIRVNVLKASKSLEYAGAHALMLCSNTMHRVLDDVRDKISIPFVDIFLATGKAVSELGCKRPILLGTLFTVESGLFARKLNNLYMIDPMIPDNNECKYINKVIYEELCNGVVRNSSRKTIISICNELCSKGADSVILGCTELTLLLSGRNFDFPVFDTTKIHVDAALDFSIG